MSFHVLVQFLPPVWVSHVVVSSIDVSHCLTLESLYLGSCYLSQFFGCWVAVQHRYFLSNASRMPIVLSLARNVDSLILWDIAQSLIDIRMPLCSTPQFPQDDVWPLCRWSNRTSTSLPHEHSHWNLRLPVDATSLTTVNSPYFFPFPITIGRNLLSLRLGFWGTFLR